MVKAMAANVCLQPLQSDIAVLYRLDSNHPSSSNAGTGAMAMLFSFCYGVFQKRSMKSVT